LTFLKETESERGDLHMVSDLCFVGQRRTPGAAPEGLENLNFLFVYDTKRNRVKCTHWRGPWSYDFLPFTIGLGYFITCEFGATIETLDPQQNPSYNKSYHKTITLRLIHTTGKQEFVTHPHVQHIYRAGSGESQHESGSITLKRIAIWQDRIICGIEHDLGWGDRGDFSWFVFQGPAV
jgi:hypothetical protein